MSGGTTPPRCNLNVVFKTGCDVWPESVPPPRRMYRWYNSSPSTVVLDQLEEVVAGCHRDSRMVPLALVNLVSMLHSRCRIELHGLVEIDDEPASVLGSQLRSVRVFRCGALPVMRVGCACCSDLHSRHIIVLV